MMSTLRGRGCAVSWQGRAGAVLATVMLAGTSATLADHGGEHHWGGFSGGVFQHADNWDPFGVPDEDDTAIFGIIGAYSVLFSDKVTNDQLIVRAGDVTFDLSDLTGPGTLRYAVTRAFPSLVVGASSVFDSTLRVRHGVLDGTTAVLGQQAGTFGTLRVQLDATVEITSSLRVGALGTGHLYVTEGGRLATAGVTHIASDPGSVGQAHVIGPESLWASTGQVHVGYQGQGELVIEQGGELTSSASFIARLPSSAGTTTGSVLVTGADSLWAIAGDLTIGFEGGTAGSLTIGAGATVTNGDAHLARFHAGSSAQVSVSGDGATWTNSNSLYVGGRSNAAGGTAVVDLGPGASVWVGDMLRIWDNGTINLDGGTLRIHNMLRSGTFNFNSGTIRLTSSRDFATDTVIADIFGASPVIGPEQSLIVNNNATIATDVTVLNGALEAVGTWIGHDVPEAATLHLGGPDARLTMLQVIVGYNGNHGRLNVHDGAVAQATYLIVADDTNVVDTLGVISVDGPGSLLELTGPLAMSFGEFAQGVLEVTAGGTFISVGAHFNAANASHSSIHVAGPGSSWSNSQSTSIGTSGTVDMSITDGGLVTTENAYLSQFSSTVNVNIHGPGSRWHVPDLLNLTSSTGSPGQSQINLAAGGILDAPGVIVLDGTTHINIHGGTLRVGEITRDQPGLHLGNAIDFSHGTVAFVGQQQIRPDSDVGEILGEMRLGFGRHLSIESIAFLEAPLHLDGGGLIVDWLIADDNLYWTGGLLESRGGGINGLMSLTIPTGGELRAQGSNHPFPVVAVAGSTITATGALGLGDDAAVNGFYSNGVINVAEHTLTLRDANDAVLDAGAAVFLGHDANPANPGTLAAPNGLTLNFGGNIAGHGSVDTPDNPATPFINNGNVTGDSLANPIILAGYVKGVGTFDNVQFTGSFAPGFSTAAVNLGSAVYSGTLVLEVNGLAPGAEHDQLNHILGQGVAQLGGTLNVHVGPNTSLPLWHGIELLLANDIAGQFDEINIHHDDSQHLVVHHQDNALLLMAALIGDMNLDGAVDTADVAPFVLALTNPQAYQSQFGIDPALVGDINQDGTFDTADVAPFVQLLVGGSAQGIPEPNAAMIFLAFAALTARRTRAGRARD